MQQSKKSNIVIFITALLFFGMFIANYGNYQLAATPQSIYAAYHLTDAQFSSLMTAPMLPSIFLSIVIGVLVDRFGISRIVAICYWISTAGFVLRVFAADYITMLAAMALTGIGCMVLNSNLAKIVSALYPMEQVGSVVGVMLAGSTASMAVAYSTTALFPSLQMAFWTAAIVSLVISLLWILFVREKQFTRQQAAAPTETVPVKEALGVCLKSKNIWLLGIALMFMLGGSTVVSNFQVSALTTLYGYSESFAATFGTVLMVGAIIGSILVPILIARSGSKAPFILLIFGLITAACQVGLVTLPTAGVYVTSFLNGAFRSGIIAVLMSLPVLFHDIGPNYAGTGGGLAVTLELLGAVVIPTYLIVPMGQGNLLNYFMLGAVCVVIASIVCFLTAKISHVYEN